MNEFRDILFNAMRYLESKHGIRIWRHFDTFQYTAPTANAKGLAEAFLDTHYHSLRKYLPLISPDTMDGTLDAAFEANLAKTPVERTITLEEYGCCRCQKHHREGDSLYEQHCHFQSKHGPVKVNLFAAIMQCAAVNGIKSRS